MNHLFAVTKNSEMNDNNHQNTIVLAFFWLYVYIIIKTNDYGNKRK